MKNNKKPKKVKKNREISVNINGRAVFGIGYFIYKMTKLYLSGKRG